MKQAQKLVDVDGIDAVSKALIFLLNAFPGLGSGKRILFSTLPESGGIGFFPSSGAALLQNREDITGHVHQVCLYPFQVLYRAAPKTDVQKIRIKDFLDTLGKWLELQPVVLNGTVYKLGQYPELDEPSAVLTSELSDALMTENLKCLEQMPEKETETSVQRKIKSIARTNAAHLFSVYEDGTEDWMLSATLQYENDFVK